eukprot:6562221-Pyramimonas_sp.AAC.1
MYYQCEDFPEPLFEVQEVKSNYEPPLACEHTFKPLAYDGPAAERCPRPPQYAVLAFFILVFRSEACW